MDNSGKSTPYVCTKRIQVYQAQECNMSWMTNFVLGPKSETAVKLWMKPKRYKICFAVSDSFNIIFKNKINVRNMQLSVKFIIFFSKCVLCLLIRICDVLWYLSVQRRNVNERDSFQQSNAFMPLANYENNSASRTPVKLCCKDWCHANCECNTVMFHVDL